MFSRVWRGTVRVIEGASLEHWFLLLSLIFGLALVFLTPPFEVPDENRHFMRAYQVSTLQLIPRAGQQQTAVAYIPASVVDFTHRQGRGDFDPGRPKPFNLDIAKQELRKPLLPDRKAEAYLGGVGVYAPVGYVPQAAAIAIGRQLNQSPMVLLYLARLASLAGFIVIGYWAVKLLPFGRAALLFMLLLPMTVFEAASSNIDGLLVATAALLVAIFARLYQSRTLLSAASRKFILTLSGVLALIKPTYLLLPFLYLLLPLRIFGDKSKQRQFWAILVLVCLLPTILWQLASRHINNITYGMSFIASPGAQLKEVIIHPVHFIVVVVDTFMQQTGDYIYVSYMGSFGWLDFRLSLLFIILGYALIVYLLFSGTKRHEFSARHRWLIGLILTATIGSIIAALYLTYSPVGASVVQGIQGRYFLPLSGLFILLAGATRREPKWVSVFGVVVLLTATVITTVSHYY